MRLALFSTLLVLVVGCAEGGEISVGGGGSGGGYGGSGATGSGSGASDDVTSGPMSSSSSTSGTGGEGGEASGGSGGGVVCNFTSPNACATADALPNVAGDGGTPAAVVTDNNSKWFKIHIKEESSSISEDDLSYRVTLISPPGMDYDLYVLEGPQDGNPNCGASPVKGAGSPEVVQRGWDDEQGLGGEDDSLWLNIEVRYVSGSVCTSFDNWTLQIEGGI